MTSAESERTLEEHLVGMISQIPDFNAAGLVAPTAHVDLQFSGPQNSCVVWRLIATHGSGPAATREQIADAETFLGWHATGRPVVIPVVSICMGADPLQIQDPAAWHHSWDRLSALAQMGVRAVGRPVLRTDSRVDEEFEKLLPQS